MYFKQIHTEHFSYSKFHWSQHPEPSAQWLIWLTFHTIYRQCLDTYSAATPVNAKPSLPGNVLRLRKRQDNVTTISWPPPLPLSPCLITFQLLQLIPDPQFPQRVGSEMKGVGWSFSPPGLFPSMSDPPSHSVSFDSWLGFSIYTHTHTPNEPWRLRPPTTYSSSITCRSCHFIIKERKCCRCQHNAIVMRYFHKESSF